MQHELIKIMIWSQYLEGLITKSRLETELRHIEDEQIRTIPLVEDTQLPDEVTLYIPRWRLN